MSAANHPASLGKYEIRGTLGKGAMGTVYDGWDRAIDRRVAIKTVRLPDANDEEAIEGLARFKREAQAAGRLTHPNIVGVFDYGETDEVAYIVMEFVEGRSLKEVLSAGERMSADTAVRLMEDVLAGLAYSHGRGVVHRDIKPANVMMAGERAKIADFGIARIEASSMTQAGTVLGTPAYMSPEQFMGQVVDRRTDIYSCGVMLYQLLAGERPFEGSMTAIMHKALTTTPPRPSELSVTSPASLDGVVAKAMARRPEDRYDTATEFATALRAHAVVADDPFASDETIVATPKRPVPVPAVVAAAPPKRTGRLPLLVGGAVAVVAVAAAAWFLLPGRGTPAGSTREAALVPQVTVPAAQSSADASRRALPPIFDAQSPAPAEVARSSALPSSAAQPVAAAPSAAPTTTEAAAQDSTVPASNPTAPAISQPTPSVAGLPEVTSTDGSAQPSKVESAPPPQPITARQQAAPALPPSQSVGQAPPPAATVSSQDAQNAGAGASPFLIPSASPQPSVAGAPSANLAQSAEPLGVTIAAEPTNAGTASVPPPATPSRPDASVAVASAPTHTAGVAPPIPAAATGAPAAPPQRLAALAPTLAPVLPPVASAPIRSAAAIQAALSVTVPSTACSLVRTTTTSDGSVTVSGVSGAQPVLREAVAAAEPVNVAWQVQNFDGPYCPALDLLRTVSEANRGRAGLDLGQIGGAKSLTDNAVIALRATMPWFGGYLHVAYLQHDATVAPLVPGPGYPPQTYAARASVELGTERPDFPGWHVGPPFGTDMIVAIATTAPLFNHPLPDSQPLAAYLASLQSAMADLRRHGGSVAAAAVVLDTRPNP